MSPQERATSAGMNKTRPQIRVYPAQDRGAIFCSKAHPHRHPRSATFQRLTAAGMMLHMNEITNRPALPGYILLSSVLLRIQTFLSGIAHARALRCCHRCALRNSHAF